MVTSASQFSSKTASIEKAYDLRIFVFTRDHAFWSLVTFTHTDP